MRRALLTAVALAASSGASPVRAEPPARHPAVSRIALGAFASAGLGTPSRESITRGQDGRGHSASAGVLLRYERRVIDWLSLAAAAGISGELSSAAIDAGYTTRRFDLGLAPHLKPLRVPNFGLLRSEAYLSIPVGVTFPKLLAPPRRAFDEEIQGRWGWYVGAGLGGALLGQNWGVFFEIEYQRHTGGTRSVLTPRDAALPPVTERLYFADHELFFNMGGLLAF